MPRGCFAGGVAFSRNSIAQRFPLDIRKLGRWARIYRVARTGVKKCVAESGKNPVVSGPQALRPQFRKRKKAATRAAAFSFREKMLLGRVQSIVALAEHRSVFGVCNQRGQPQGQRIARIDLSEKGQRLGG